MPVINSNNLCANSSEVHEWDWRTDLLNLSIINPAGVQIPSESTIISAFWNLDNYSEYSQDLSLEVKALVLSTLAGT